MKYVFVYGTLKKGYRLHQYLQKSTFIGEGILENHIMYVLGWYPGVVKSKSGSVLGEVYQIDQPTLDILDDVEANGILFQRKPEIITLIEAYPQHIKKTCSIEAWVYKYLGDVGSFKILESGKF